MRCDKAPISVFILSMHCSVSDSTAATFLFYVAISKISEFVKSGEDKVGGYFYFSGGFYKLTVLAHPCLFVRSF